MVREFDCLQPCKMFILQFLIQSKKTLNQSKCSLQNINNIYDRLCAKLSFLYKHTTVTYSQNRQSIKFQNHENIYFVEKLYFFILYNQVYIAKHVLKSLHSGFIFRENTNHYKVGW